MEWHLRVCVTDEGTGAYTLKIVIRYARVPEGVEHTTMCRTAQEVVFVVVIWSDKGAQCCNYKCHKKQQDEISN